MKELIELQRELKVPKARTNNFGKYKYRSCEDILEALKPLMAKLGVYILLSDEIVTIGGFNYVKATAMLCNSQDKSITLTAYAKEPEALKGMSSAQVTGATSSYARKYALNGLLAIDDSEDIDGKEDSTADRYEKTEAEKAVFNEAIKYYDDQNAVKAATKYRECLAYGAKKQTAEMIAYYKKQRADNANQSN